MYWECDQSALRCLDVLTDLPQKGVRLAQHAVGDRVFGPSARDWWSFLVLLNKVLRLLPTRVYHLARILGYTAPSLQVESCGCSCVRQAALQLGRDNAYTRFRQKAQQPIDTLRD